MLISHLFLYSEKRNEPRTHSSLIKICMDTISESATALSHLGLMENSIRNDIQLKSYLSLTSIPRRNNIIGLPNIDTKFKLWHQFMADLNCLQLTYIINIYVNTVFCYAFSSYIHSLICMFTFCQFRTRHGIHRVFFIMTTLLLHLFHI